MKRKLAITLVSAFAFSAVTVTPALADHNVGPCNDEPEPGNAAFARHHIVPLATTQGMGADGHVPGAHQGYSTCLH